MDFTEFYRSALEPELLLLNRKRKLILPASILSRAMFASFFIFIWAIFTTIAIRLKQSDATDLFVPVFRIFLAFLLTGIFTIISVFSAKELVKRYPSELASKGRQVLLGFGIFSLISGIDLLSSFIISSNVTNFNDLDIGKMIGLFFVLGIGGGILLYNLIKIENKFKIEFKKRIIAKIVVVNFPGSTYQPERGIPEVYFLESKLFPTYGYSTYKGSDFLNIVTEGVEMEISYLDISRQPISNRTGTNGFNNNSRTIFDGLFFRMVNNKENQGITWVYHHSIGIKVIGKIVSTFNNVFGISGSNLVKTGDPDFDKKFLVYTNNPDPGFFSLESGKIKSIKDVFENSKSGFSLSFVDRFVFLALRRPLNVFDPPIFRSLMGIEKMQKYVTALKEIYGYHVLAD